MGAVFALFSGWYFWIPKMLALMYNVLLGNVHFWILFIGVNLTFFPQHFLGLQGMPRRISDYPDAYTGWNIISSYGSIISVVATWLFLEILYTQLVRGKVVFGYPWLNPQYYSDTIQALLNRAYNSLEWSLDNPPKPHAFTSLPVQAQPRVLSGPGQYVNGKAVKPEAAENCPNMFTFHLKGTPFKTGFDLSNLSISEISTLLKDYRKDPEAEEANIKKLEDMIKARAQKVARQRKKEKMAEEKEKKAETETAESSSSNQGEKKAEAIEGSLTNHVESKADTIGASSSSLIDHCDAPNAWSNNIKELVIIGRECDSTNSYYQDYLYYLPVFRWFIIGFSLYAMAKMLGYLHLPPKPHAFTSLSIKAVIFPQDRDTHSQSDTVLNEHNINHTLYKYDKKPIEELSISERDERRTNIEHEMHSGGPDEETIGIIRNQLEEINNITRDANLQDMDNIIFAIWYKTAEEELSKIEDLDNMGIDPRLNRSSDNEQSKNSSNQVESGNEQSGNLSNQGESGNSIDTYNVNNLSGNTNFSDPNNNMYIIDGEDSFVNLNPSYYNPDIYNVNNISDTFDLSEDDFIIDLSDNSDSSDAPRAWGIYFQDSASPQMEGIVELHNLIMYFLIIILFSVGWILLTTIKNFAHNKWPISNKYLNHGTLIELIWTISPAIILILIAFPSFKLLYVMDEVIDPILTISTTAHQWYWSYEYPDFYKITEEFLNFDSYIVPTSDLEEGTLRMLEVDNRVILPELTHVRFILTSEDVIHSYACPALGIKCDAYPGRLNQFSTYASREGTFYGQCSEICGLLHSSMPIAIESVSLEKFLLWLKEQL